MKKIFFFVFLLSFSYSSHNSSEYSIGINDKTGFFGWFSKSWIKEKDHGESYITAGGLGIIGSVGYGEKHYFSKGSFFSPYVSLTGFGYYILPMSENGEPKGSLGISGNLGVDVTTIKWKKNELKFQFGLFTAYDIINYQSLILPGEGGPSFLMPSVNIKVRFRK